MKITKEQLAEMQEASKPLREWMAKNCHQLTRIILEAGRVELVEVVAGSTYTEET